MADIEHLALADRPAFARRMVAVWRKQHLAMGERLSVAVWPGEWPDGVEPVVAGTVPVVQSTQLGGPGGVLVLGRIGDVWRGAYTVAFTFPADLSVDDLALITGYMEVADPDQPMKLWLHPSPTTGEVPMWLIPRKART